eukprot:jgi/Bigna1/60224/fgenesh1_kg.10_\
MSMRDELLNFASSLQLMNTQLAKHKKGKSHLCAITPTPLASETPRGKFKVSKRGACCGSMSPRSSRGSAG